MNNIVEREKTAEIYEPSFELIFSPCGVTMVCDVTKVIWASYSQWACSGTPKAVFEFKDRKIFVKILVEQLIKKTGHK
jgi:hypothetical protein